jgi:L-threonylcarbamoyladenylate synthase
LLKNLKNLKKRWLSKLKKKRKGLKVYKISHEQPEPEIIQHAGTIIKRGGIIAFPTRCLYGLGADAFNADAVDRVFKIKQRPSQKPILVLIDRRIQLQRLVSHVSKTAWRIMDHFWPGGVTLVFEAGDTVPNHLTAGTGKIGIRLPGHPVAAALVGALGRPLTGTSANLSAKPGCRRIGDLEPQLTQHLDAVLDAGPLKGGNGSTVIDVTGDIPRILREGEISEKEILTLTKR